MALPLIPALLGSLSYTPAFHLLSPNRTYNHFCSDLPVSGRPWPTTYLQVLFESFDVASIHQFLQAQHQHLQQNIRPSSKSERDSFKERNCCILSKGQQPPAPSETEFLVLLLSACALCSLATRTLGFSNTPCIKECTFSLQGNLLTMI